MSINTLKINIHSQQNLNKPKEKLKYSTHTIVDFSFGEQKTHNSSFQGVQVGELSSPALIDYLRGRGINIELAKRECKELRFEHNNKPYFAIGFPNMSGGYELRNRDFKGRLAPKDVTYATETKQSKQRKSCKSNPQGGCHNRSRRRNEASGYSPL